MYNKFEKYLSEDEVASTSGDIATFTKKLKKPLKTKNMELECDKTKNESEIDSDELDDIEGDSEEESYMCNDDFDTDCNWCGTEDDLVDSDGENVCPECGSSVSEGFSCDDEEDDDEEDDEDDYEEEADIDGDGEITADDVYSMVDGLSKTALIEIIDLIASYLENKFEEPSDIIPADGKARFYESVIRKVSSTSVSKKSGKLGHKLVDGKEKPMNRSDVKKRVQDGIKAGKKRKSRARKSK